MFFFNILTAAAGYFETLLSDTRLHGLSREPRILKLKITHFSKLVVSFARTAGSFSTGLMRGVIPAWPSSRTCSISRNYRLFLTCRCRHCGTTPGRGAGPSSHSPYQFAASRLTSAPRPEDLGVLRLCLHICRYGAVRGGGMTPVWNMILALQSILLLFSVCLTFYRKTEQVNAAVTLKTGTQWLVVRIPGYSD